MGTGVDQAITVEIDLTEDDETTEARATCEVAGQQFDGRGQARRSPGEPSCSVVAEELAVARALSQLSNHLIEAAGISMGVRPQRHT